MLLLLAAATSPQATLPQRIHSPCSKINALQRRGESLQAPLLPRCSVSPTHQLRVSLWTTLQILLRFKQDGCTESSRLWRHPVPPVPHSMILSGALTHVQIVGWRTQYVISSYSDDGEFLWSRHKLKLESSQILPPSWNEVSFAQGDTPKPSWKKKHDWHTPKHGTMMLKRLCKGGM